MKQARAFGMVDLLILLVFGISAVAAAVWRDREFTQNQNIDRRTQLDEKALARRPGWVWSLELPLRRASVDLQTFLVVATVGSGTALLRRPGLFRARSWPAPGWVAGAVGMIAVVFCVALVFVSLKSTALWVRVLRSRFLATFFLLAGQAVQGTILGAWALLAVGREWVRRPADWDDCLGRILGWSWLGLYCYEILYPVIWT